MTNDSYRFKFDCMVMFLNLNVSMHPMLKTYFNGMINRFVLALLVNFYLFSFNIHFIDVIDS